MPKVTPAFESLKKDVERQFDGVLMLLSDPFRDELLKYREGTLMELESSFEKFISEWEDTLYAFQHYEKGVRTHVKEFLEEYRAVDMRYRETLKSIDVRLFDLLIFLKTETQAEAFLSMYIQAAKDLFHRHLFTSFSSSPPFYSAVEYGKVRINKHNYSVLFFQHCGTAIYSLQYNIDGAFQMVVEQNERLAKSLQSGVKSSRTNRLPEDHEQQEHQTQNETPPSPDLDMLQSLKAEREKLMRTLQSL